MRLFLGVLLAAGWLAGADFKIVVVGSDRSSWSSDEAAMAAYRKAAPKAQIVRAATAADVTREVADADGIIGGGAKGQVWEAEKLTWVRTYIAGVGEYLWEGFFDSGGAL